mmetsp:Transcript_26073/g.77923  ORF Transcript_26073/g.77923 Transcript_26073/m.77923 type:complete len:338 (-) Transcript_26073:541-1554(-)
MENATSACLGRDRASAVPKAFHLGARRSGLPKSEPWASGSDAARASTCTQASLGASSRSRPRRLSAMHASTAEAESSRDASSSRRATKAFAESGLSALNHLDMHATAAPILSPWEVPPTLTTVKPRRRCTCRNKDDGGGGRSPVLTKRSKQSRAVGSAVMSMYRRARLNQQSQHFGKSNRSCRSSTAASQAQIAFSKLPSSCIFCASPIAVSLPVKGLSSGFFTRQYNRSELSSLEATSGRPSAAKPCNLLNMPPNADFCDVLTLPIAFLAASSSLRIAASLGSNLAAWQNTSSACACSPNPASALPFLKRAFRLAGSISSAWLQTSTAFFGAGGLP